MVGEVGDDADELVLAQHNVAGWIEGCVDSHPADSSRADEDERVIVACEDLVDAVED